MKRIHFALAAAISLLLELLLALPQGFLRVPLVGRLLALLQRPVDGCEQPGGGVL